MIFRHKYRKINVPMLCRVMGLLIMIESLFMALPLTTAIYFGEDDIKAFAITMGLTLLCGASLWRFSRPQSKSMGKREGFLLTGLVWVVFSFFGMLPFIISRTPYTVGEAYIEAMSGFTTTGATIIPDVEVLSQSAQMWRALMQWLGGMGIVIFTVAVTPMLNQSGGVQLYNAEVTGITHDKLMPRISHTAKLLWLTYIALTVLCVVCLCLGPVRFFDGVVQSLGTISTGGFSPYNDGINAYHSDYVKGILTVFMFVGGVNFALIYGMVLGRFRQVWTNEPLRWFVCIIVIFFAIFLVNAYVHRPEAPFGSTCIDVLCQTVSAMTSTSYAVDGVNTWGAPVLGALVFLMYFGGTAGSTSGGAKTDRLIVMLRFARNETRRALQPNSVPTVNFGRRVISSSLVMKVVAFLCLSVLVVIVGAFLLTCFGVPVVDAFYSCLSAISNSGLCIDIGEYGGSFVPIPEAGKWVLAVIMMTGRLEIFTVLVLFTGDFWHK